MLILFNIFYWISISIVVIFFGLYVYLKYVFGYWKRKGVKYLECPTFPFGNLWALINNEKSLNLQTYDFYQKLQGPYGGLVMINHPTLFIKDLEIIKQILVKDFNNFCDRGDHGYDDKEPLSGLLFRLNGEKWRRMRSKLNQAFTPARIKRMFNFFLKCAQQQEEYLDSCCESDINISECSVKFTADCIASSIFGMEVNSFSDPKNDFWSKMVHTFHNYSTIRYTLFLFGQYVPNIVKKLNISTLFKKSIEQIFQRVQKIIDYREKNAIFRDDFMQTMIQLKNGGKDSSDKFNIMEIACSVYSMFFAGFDTSANTISFCLHLLALNPEIQLRVQNEIDSVLEKHEGAITYESLMDMQYLDCVIKEVLRLYPALGHLTRCAVNDYQIPNSPLIIEKGTIILMSLHGLHHDPEYFPNPEKFDPDRFLPENKTSIRNFTYMPFGEGLRLCIGRKFGILVTIMGVVNLLKKNSFYVCEKTDLELQFNLKNIVHTPANPIILGMKRRQIH